VRVLQVKKGIVTEYDIDDSLESMYELLECEIFTTAGYLPNGDVAYVDDMGLLTATTATHFHHVTWYGQPLAGNILVIGVDGMGDSTDAKTTLAELQEMVIV
jgi:hypothetical protein